MYLGEPSVVKLPEREAASQVCPARDKIVEVLGTMCVCMLIQDFGR